MARRANPILSTLYFVVGALEIAMALWAIRLLPGAAAVLLIVGGLLCILAGMDQR